MQKVQESKIPTLWYFYSSTRSELLPPLTIHPEWLPKQKPALKVIFILNPALSFAFSNIIEIQPDAAYFFSFRSFLDFFRRACI